MATDIVQRLRNLNPWGEPGWPEDIKEAAAHIEALQRRVEELEAALKPFADAIYNDNGDITVDLSVKSEDLVKAYFVLRRVALIQEKKKDG
jgi:hypothetical protein